MVMLRKAFFRAQICDFNSVYDFVKYCKNLLYTAKLYHSSEAKIAFIHKLPQGLNRLLLEQLKENGINLNAASMGKITQTLQEVINYLCTQQQAKKEVKVAKPSSRFCKHNYYTRDFGCKRKERKCHCSSKKTSKHHPQTKRHFKRKLLYF